MTDSMTTGERAPDEVYAERFAIVPEWLLVESASVVKLYALLDRYANRDRRLWPGQAELAERMECSDRTVRTHLKRLQEIGALREEKRRWNGSTVYSLLPVRPETSFRPEATDRKPLSAPSGTQLPPNESHELEPSSNDSEFEAFWTAYPRREAKGSARGAFAKATKSVAPETIIAAAANYALRCKNENREAKYIAHPSTWLNQERWADDEAPAPETRKLTYDELINMPMPKFNVG